MSKETLWMIPICSIRNIILSLHFSCGRTGSELENKLTSLESWNTSLARGIPHALLPAFFGTLCGEIPDGPTETTYKLI